MNIIGNEHQSCYLNKNFLSVEISFIKYSNIWPRKSSAPCQNQRTTTASLVVHETSFWIKNNRHSIEPMSFYDHLLAGAKETASVSYPCRLFFKHGNATTRNEELATQLRVTRT